MEEIYLLNESLMQYGMPDAKSELIRHNENMTYCIDGKYLLRIHKPKDGFNTTSYYKDADIVRIHESELNFIEHLQECGVYVQSTIRNVKIGKTSL